MPNRKVHKRISKIIAGNPCEKVHYLMDFPYKFLGRNHRVIFHDPISAFFIGYILYGKDGVIPALAHIATDYYDSRLNRYIKFWK